MGMGAGVAVAAQPDIGMHNDAHRPPMRNLMQTVGDFPIGYGDMQDEWFEGGDFHGVDSHVSLCRRRNIYMIICAEAVVAIRRLTACSCSINSLQSHHPPQQCGFCTRTGYGGRFLAGASKSSAEP